MTTSKNIELSFADVSRLYGKQFFLADPVADSPSSSAEEPDAPVPASEVKIGKPGIVWRPKDTSKVLFTLHQSELKNKVLTELLKQIVHAIGIPFPSAGFGIITDKVQPGEFDKMPNPYAIVFDESLLPGTENPIVTPGGTVFFTMRLNDLQHNRTAKRALWEFLKSIKPNL